MERDGEIVIPDYIQVPRTTPMMMDESLSYIASVKGQ